MMYKYYVEMDTASGDKIERKEFSVPGTLRIFDQQRHLILEWRSPAEEPKQP